MRYIEQKNIVAYPKSLPVNERVNFEETGEIMGWLQMEFACDFPLSNASIK